MQSESAARAIAPLAPCGRRLPCRESPFSPGRGAGEALEEGTASIFAARTVSAAA